MCPWKACGGNGIKLSGKRLPLSTHASLLFRALAGTHFIDGGTEVTERLPQMAESVDGRAVTLTQIHPAVQHGLLAAAKPLETGVLNCPWCVGKGMAARPDQKS